MSRYPLAMYHPATGVQYAFNAVDEQNMIVRGWTVAAPAENIAVASAPVAESAGAAIVKRKPGRPPKVRVE